MSKINTGNQYSALYFLFFPEKRLFFQERSSTFDFNLGGPNRRELGTANSQRAGVQSELFSHWLSLQTVY